MPNNGLDNYSLFSLTVCLYSTKVACVKIPNEGWRGGMTLKMNIHHSRVNVVLRGLWAQPLLGFGVQFPVAQLFSLLCLLCSQVWVSRTNILLDWIFYIIFSNNCQFEILTEKKINLSWKNSVHQITCGNVDSNSTPMCELSLHELYWAIYVTPVTTNTQGTTYQMIHFKRQQFSSNRYRCLTNIDLYHNNVRTSALCTACSILTYKTNPPSISLTFDPAQNLTCWAVNALETLCILPTSLCRCSTVSLHTHQRAHIHLPVSRSVHPPPILATVNV